MDCGSVRKHTGKHGLFKMTGQLLISGLTIGSIYALLALAMNIIYKASEIPNFAQGDMAMISTYIAYMIMVIQGWPFWIAFLGAIGFAIILGFVFEFLFIRQAKEPNLLNLIIITLGFQLFLYGMAGWKWGADQRRLQMPFSESDTYEFGGIIISHLGIATITTAIIIMLVLWLFLSRTKLGVAMKAVQQNPEAARINGIPRDRILGISFATSSVIGAIAGMLIAPVTILDPNMMWDPLIKGFSASVLGGMTSLPGAVIGGYILGITENLFGFYISSEFKSVVAFAIIILILIFRPSGLLGHHYVRKV